MNTYKQAQIFCKAKAGHQCFFLLMCFHLVLGVPGPCRHSVTEEHLLNITRLIANQLQNGCSTTYKFIEHHNLSKICYVKAAFPQILDLLNTHFKYDKGSDNYGYVDKLKKMVENIYSEECLPQIDDTTEDDPVRFAKEYSGSVREALGKIKEVVQLYMELMTKNDKPVDWNCEEEYAGYYPESTTAFAQTTGSAECHCSCPSLGHGASEQVALPGTSQWKELMQPSYLQSRSFQPPNPAQPPTGTMEPWDYITVSHDYDTPQRLEEADSITSVTKAEEEEVNRNIPSSRFLAFLRTNNFGSRSGSTASFNEKNSGPKDPSTSCHRVHLESVPRVAGTSESLDGLEPSTVSAESKQGMDIFVSRTLSEKRSPAVVASAFMQSSTKTRISGLTTGQSSYHGSFFDSFQAIASSSKEHAESMTTPMPSHEAPVRSTLMKPEDTTAVFLVKRSLGQSEEGSQSSSETDNQAVQYQIPANSPSASSHTLYKNVAPADLAEISQVTEKTKATTNTVLLPRQMVEDNLEAFSGLPVRPGEPLVSPSVPKQELAPMLPTAEKLESPGPGSRQSADLMNSSSAQVDRGSGKDLQNGAQGESLIAYKIAFIAASVCGGLLLLMTLYYFRKQKKLKALLQREVKENQRLTSCSKNIEMEHFETEQSRLESS